MIKKNKKTCHTCTRPFTHVKGLRDENNPELIRSTSSEEVPYKCNLKLRSTAHMDLLLIWPRGNIYQ